MSSIQEALRKAQIEKEGRERPEIHIGFMATTRRKTFKRPILLIAPILIASMILACLWLWNLPLPSLVRSTNGVHQDVSLTETSVSSSEKSQKEKTSNPPEEKRGKPMVVTGNDRIKRNGLPQSPQRSTVSRPGKAVPSIEKSRRGETSSPPEEKKGKATKLVGNDRIKRKSAGVQKEGFGRSTVRMGLRGQEAYKRAIAMHRKGDLDRAIELYRLSIRGPEVVQDAFIQLGNIYFEKKNAPEEAIVYYRRALKVNPNDAKAHNNLGTCYLKKGNVPGAIREYLKAIELRDDFAIAYYNMACALVRQGEFQKAISWLKKAIAINPECLRWSKEDPDFDRIRDHRGFQELLEREKVEEQPQRG